MGVEFRLHLGAALRCRSSYSLGKHLPPPPPPQETSRFVLCGSDSVAGRLKGAKCPDDFCSFHKLLFSQIVDSTPYSVGHPTLCLSA